MNGTAVTSSSSASEGTLITATASCAPGKMLLGGGARVTTDDAGHAERTVLAGSYPSTATVWTGIGVVTGSNLGNGKHMTVQAFALCNL